MVNEKCIYVRCCQKVMTTKMKLFEMRTNINVLRHIFIPFENEYVPAKKVKLNKQSKVLFYYDLCFNYFQVASVTISRKLKNEPFEIFNFFLHCFDSRLEMFFHSFF